MNFFIITGASRGLGLGITRLLLKPENRIVCVSRKKNTELAVAAEKAGCILTWLELDLGRTKTLENRLPDIFPEGELARAASAVLINNAGIVEPVKPAGDCTGEEINRIISVNLTAPMVLCSGFIRHTEKFPIPKTIMNISSGAGRKPYHGWSAYCASKAGLDHYTRTVGLEQSRVKNPVRILAVAPGIVDTDMQALLREKTERDFELLEKFKEYKAKGYLTAPEAAAGKILTLPANLSFDNGAVLDIRDLE